MRAHSDHRISTYNQQTSLHNLSQPSLIKYLHKYTEAHRGHKKRQAPNCAKLRHRAKSLSRIFFLLITTHQNTTFGPMGKSDWPCGSMQSQSDTG
jgi:hypothetical protein